MSEDEKLVVQRIKNKLGDADEWRTPKGYPQSLALCAIDSVFSLNAHYSSTMKVVDRYTTVRIAEGQDPSVDGLAELVETIDRHGGPKVSAAELFNNFSIAPGTAKHKNMALLKSEALYQASQGLLELGVSTAEDLRDAMARSSDSGRQIKVAWKRVRGLGDASWAYLGMNAHIADVKADRMIIRFVQKALNEKKVTAQRASEAVKAAAAHLGHDLITLDHAIWRQESGRT